MQKIWLRLDLDGVILNMQIRGYAKSSKLNWDEAWCDVEYSFVCEPWFNYGADNEMLLAGEVENLAKMLDDLLSNRMEEAKEFECIEPDFKFVLNPKKDLRLDPKCSCIRPGCEIKDIGMEWRIPFWYGTENYMSVMFYREDIEDLLVYLKLVMGVLSRKDEVVQQRIQRKVLISYYPD